MLEALGLIETKGLVGAIEAADAMLKAANVKLIAKERATGALINIRIVGEVAAVKSAVDAGAAAAQRVGELVSAHVIPRPDGQIDGIVTLKNFTSKIPRPVPDEREQETIVFEAEPPAATVREKVEEEKPALVPKEAEEPEITQPLFEGNLPDLSELEKMNVHQLRRLARQIENFPIKGRQISKANRTFLLECFEKIR